MPFLSRHIAAFCIAGSLTAPTALADDPASQPLRDQQQTLRQLEQQRGCSAGNAPLGQRRRRPRLHRPRRQLLYLAPRWHLDSPVDNRGSELTGRRRMSLGLRVVTLARERPVHILVKKSSYLRSKVAVSSNSANIRTP